MTTSQYSRSFHEHREGNQRVMWLRLKEIPTTSSILEKITLFHFNFSHATIPTNSWHTTIGTIPISGSAFWMDASNYYFFCRFRAYRLLLIFVWIMALWSISTRCGSKTCCSRSFLACTRGFFDLLDYQSDTSYASSSRKSHLLSTAHFTFTW